MTLAHLDALGWTDELTAAWAALERPDLRPARIAAVHRGRVVVRDGLVEDRQAPVAGALEHHTQTVPVTGDWVGSRDDGGVEAILPRRGTLSRGDDILAAHVDLALVITSANRDVNPRRVERFLAMAAGGGAQTLVVLSKDDLADDADAEAAELAAAVDCEVLRMSVREGRGLDALLERLVPGRTTALVGSSGVGKSTLVNALLGEERQHTLSIRSEDDRGRHATRHRELFALPGGAILLDTPGLRMPAMASGDGLEATFGDVDALEAQCRFSDCSHNGEPGCAVGAAIAAGELDPERLAARDKLAVEGGAQETRASGIGGAAKRGRARANQRGSRRARGKG